MTGSKRIGYLGGTFDPPHLGHEMLAGEALYQLKLDAVRWLITPDPPHKLDQELTPIESRLEMVQLIINRQEEYAISEVDLGRPPPYYAADTVEIIKEGDPNSQLVYIVGEDSLGDLPEWYQPDRFLTAIDQLAVAPRPGYQTDLESLELKLPGLTGKLVFLTEIMVEISSSLIRDRIRTGGEYEHFLAEDVVAYIEQNQLYRR